MNKNFDHYNASFSQVDITPDFQTSLVGCYRPDPRSQGILHRLYAQVLLFQKADTSSETAEYFCLITIDNLGLTVRLADSIRSDIAARIGTDAAHVMLNFSHTHSAPEPTEYGLNGERYFKFLHGQIMACVADALHRFRPCSAGWALGRAEIADNRRDGCSVTDPRLGGLLVCEAHSEAPIVLVLRIAAHNNILMWQNNKISSDFIGVAREDLARIYGCPVMVLQGAAGNLKPVGVAKIGGGGLDDLHRIADLFVSQAKGLSFKPRTTLNLRMFTREITFTADVPSKDEAERIAGITYRELSERIGTENHEWTDSEIWLRSCEDLRKKGIREQAIPAQISFFKLNEGGFCGVSEEIFCEPALEVQARTHCPLLFLNGYTNGCTGYLPSREEWHKGGYEVYGSNFVYHKYHGHVMPYRDDTADRIVDLVVREWNAIK